MGAFMIVYARIDDAARFGAYVEAVQPLIAQHGAVSEETVLEMARGARKLFDADIAISVSGIAGPTGGTDEKPVGTTWVGLSTNDGEWARHFVWDGDREQNKHYSSDAALQFIIDYLEGKLT